MALVVDVSMRSSYDLVTAGRSYPENPSQAIKAPELADSPMDIKLASLNNVVLLIAGIVLAYIVNTSSSSLFNLG